MPSWQPEWADVQFDHAAAGAYAHACDQGVRTLHAWVSQREALARHAVAGWEGPHRLSFDRRLVAVHDLARRQAVALSTEAEEVRLASAMAAFEQRRRYESREQWFREQAAEQETARLEAAAQEQRRLAEAGASSGVPAGAAGGRPF